MTTLLLHAVSLFLPAAVLLTAAPGADTLLVLRSASSAGVRAGIEAAMGIALGCLVWASCAAFGLAALIAASPLAYTVLQWAGAGYLCCLGVKALTRPRSQVTAADTAARSGFASGLFTNLLNPKVGVFYVSFLPQFVPAGAPVALTVLLLGAVHAALGVLWLSLLSLGTHSVADTLRRPRVVSVMDRLTGILFIGFGVRLALSSSR